MKLENYSKGLFLICGLILILVGVPRLFLNNWIAYSEYLFFAALVLFLIGAAFSYKKILDFFSMRTTKYGMNMGTLIFMGFILYACINFFAFRYDKSVDITADKINSLSLESLEILDSLKEPVEFRVYHQGAVHSNQNITLKLMFKKYQRESPMVKPLFIDAHKDPSSAKYLKREDLGKIVVFISKGERTERVREPISEESLTAAMFRLGQTDSKKIYFLTGHGERNISDQKGSGTGVNLLNEALKMKGLKTDTLNLLQKQKVPEDAAMLAVLGPKKALFEKELILIKDYLAEGGRVLVAGDPSQKTNLNSLVRPFGVEFEENYLLATQTVTGADALSVLGQRFDVNNAITAKFDPNAITLFYETSGLKKIKAKKNFKTSLMVETPLIVIPVKSLETYKKEIEGKDPVSKTVAMTVEGDLGDEAHKGHDHAENEIPKFMLAVFGDSDFLTDIYFETGFNKDLALNTFAELSGLTNLITIRPRTAKDTKLVLTTGNSTFVVLIPILIPLLLLIIAAILWFRKRGA